MTDFSEIYDRWKDLWDSKEEYAFGDMQFDLDDYKDLVKKTYYIIKEMHDHIENCDYSGISAEEMRNYIDLVSVISLYAAPLLIDESEDNAFLVSTLLAYDLADLGANYSLYANDEDEPLKEGVISSLEGFSYGIERTIYYDINKGDISDYIELANMITEE